MKNNNIVNLSNAFYTTLAIYGIVVINDRGQHLKEAVRMLFDAGDNITQSFENYAAEYVQDCIEGYNNNYNDFCSNYFDSYT